MFLLYVLTQRHPQSIWRKILGFPRVYPYLMFYNVKVRLEILCELKLGLIQVLHSQRTAHKVFYDNRNQVYANPLSHVDFGELTPIVLDNISGKF